MRAAYVYRDVDANSIVFRPCLRVLVKLLGIVVSNHQCVLGKVLEETLGRRAINEEVQRLGDGAQGQKREDRPHVGRLGIGARDWRLFACRRGDCSKQRGSRRHELEEGSRKDLAKRRSSCAVVVIVLGWSLAGDGA